MTSSPPPSGSPSGDDVHPVTERPHSVVPSRGWTDLRPRAWNLLLLVPLISCIPPLFNSTEPRLGGLPFFYWFQLVVIPIGILCTVTVHRMTRHVDEEDSAAGSVASEDPAATERKAGR